MTEAEEADFRACLGKVMWIARLTRPDVAFEAAACAQKYGEGDGPLQEYNESNISDPFFKDESGDGDERDRTQGDDGDTDHMPGIKCYKMKTEEIKKINLDKKKKAMPEISHLEVKNILALNKAVRGIKARRDVKIVFSDITNKDKKKGATGINGVRINAHCDASLMNVEGSRSQIGVVAMIMSITDEITLPQDEYRAPDRKLARNMIKNQPYVKACPIVWSSFKCQRVATSSYASELQAAFCRRFSMCS